MNKTAKIGFVSLGCSKNSADSERILTQLKTEGYDIAQTFQDADLVIVNTCGFIDSAKEESLSVIGESLQENGKVIVTGCLGSNKDEITNIFPNVLAVVGPAKYEEVLSEVHKVVKPAEHSAYTSLVPPQGIRLTPKHYAYLKISEGCNNSCTFCIIPMLRGKLESRTIASVLNEAENLVKAGVKELIIIAQDTTVYGLDKKYKLDFWQGKPLKTNIEILVKELANFGIWVRLHYIYPYPFVDKLVELMSDGLILPYLDIPFQHAHPKVLKNMKRPANDEKLLDRITSWRKICPDIAIRSTFIVGFPGESDEEFEYLLSWLQAANLDGAGCFEYSPVKGAPSNQLNLTQVMDFVKQHRWDMLMQTQREISSNKLQLLKNRDFSVIVDGFNEENNMFYGRTFKQSPDVDGITFIDTKQELQIGSIVSAKVTETYDYDLVAKLNNSLNS